MVLQGVAYGMNSVAQLTEEITIGMRPWSSQLCQEQHH
jgi:hypothetical protein